MCGHVGIAGKLEYKDEATMKRMLLFDYFRGMDSTGFAAVRNNKSLFLTKIASHPIDFFDTKKFAEALTGHSSRVFIGHNRAATRGKVSAVNAHPFEFGHIVGAHNGTLTDASHKELDSRLGYETDVDSQAIFAHIEKFGIDETVPLLTGAWALVWYDFQKDTINFIRNKERSFYYAMSKDLKKVFWASEWPTIQAAVEMHGTATPYELHYDKDEFCFWPTEVDQLYTFPIEDLQEGPIEFTDGKVKQLKGKEPPKVVTTTTGGGNPFVRPGTGNGTTQTMTTMGTVPSSSSSASGNVHRNLNVTQMTIVMSDSKPFGDFLDKESFDALSNNACSYCCEPVHYDDEGLSVYESSAQVLCSGCTGKETTRYIAKPVTFNNYMMKV